MNRAPEIITAILTAPESRDEIFQTLSPNDFHGACGEWYEKLAGIYASAPDRLDDPSIAMQAFSALQPEMKAMTREGWQIALPGMVDDSIRRKVAAAVATIECHVADTTLSPEKLIELIKGVVAVAEDSRVVGKRELSIHELQAQAYAQAQKGIESVTWGLRALDQSVRLRCGDEGAFVILGARPAVGKTAMFITCAALQMMCGISVGIIGIETSYIPYLYRLQAIISGFTFAQLESGDQTRNMTRQFMETQLKFNQHLHMSCCDSSMSNAKAKIRHWVAKGVKCIFIDHVGVLKGDRRRPRHEEVAGIANDLHALTRELGVPIVLLTQLNRESAGTVPKVSNIANSDVLEQNADIVMLLDRPDCELPDPGKRPYKQDTTGKMVVLTLKNRYGQTGLQYYNFNAPHMRVEPVDRIAGTSPA